MDVVSAWPAKAHADIFAAAPAVGQTLGLNFTFHVLLVAVLQLTKFLERDFVNRTAADRLRFHPVWNGSFHRGLNQIENFASV